MVKQRNRFCCQYRDPIKGWPVKDRVTGLVTYFPYRSNARRVAAVMNGKVTLPDPAQHITNRAVA